jgi:hypothetical protein
MWSWEKKQKENTQVSEVDYKALAEKLEAQVKRLEDQINTICHESKNEDFVFDFKAVKVFSVERNWKDYQPATIVGYIINEPYSDSSGIIGTKECVKEWYLYCSKEQHAKLVEQFRKSMKG